MKNINENKFSKIYRVNNLIRGVFIDKGKNLYAMSYNPIENRLGSIVSFSSFVILLLLLFIGIYGTFPASLLLQLLNMWLLVLSSSSDTHQPITAQ